MKTMEKGILACVLICILIGSAAAVSQVRAPDVVLQSGETITGTIDINGVDGLTGLDLDLDYDPSLVSVSAIGNASFPADVTLISNPTDSTQLSAVINAFPGVDVSTWTGVIDLTITSLGPEGSCLLGFEAAKYVDSSFLSNDFDEVNNGSILVGESLQADVSVTKTFTAGTYYPGDDVEWTVTVTNNGPDTAVNVVVEDDVSGLIDVSISSVTPSTGSFVGTTWTVGDLASGASETLTIVTSFSSIGEKTNAVSASSDTADPDATNNLDSATVGIVELPPPDEADVSVTKTFTAGTYYPGDDVEWTVTVTNNGPDTAVNVVVEDDVSGLIDVSISSVTPSTGSFVGTTWTVGDLASGASETLTIVTSFSSIGEKTNAVSASSDTADPDATNNLDSATVTISEKEAIDVHVTIKPGKLNLKSKGVLTVKIVFPDGCDLSGIDPSTIALEDAFGIRGEISEDDCHVYMVKFDRQDLGLTGNGMKSLCVSGIVECNGIMVDFEGCDMIDVI